MRKLRNVELLSMVSFTEPEFINDTVPTLTGAEENWTQSSRRLTGHE